MKNKNLTELVKKAEFIVKMPIENKKNHKN